jgi:flagellar basal body-associated protein FliL
MKKSTKIIIGIIVIITLVGVGLFLNNIFKPACCLPNQETPQQTEETNLETYEEDFKAIDEVLDNID